MQKALHYDIKLLVATSLAKAIANGLNYPVTSGRKKQPTKWWKSARLGDFVIRSSTLETE